MVKRAFSEAFFDDNPVVYVLDTLVHLPIKIIRRVLRLPSYWGRQIDASLANNISIAPGRVSRGNRPNRNRPRYLARDELNNWIPGQTNESNPYFNYQRIPYNRLLDRGVPNNRHRSGQFDDV